MHASAADSAPQRVRASHLALPPAARDVVRRERLLDRLDHAAHGAVALVTGGMGAGKTTLLVAWAHRAPMPVAWLSLDEDAADATALAWRMVAALERITPGCCPLTARLLRQPDRTAAAALGEALADDLAALDRDLGLILDDAHLLAAGDAPALLNALLSRPPARLHLVLGTRTALPLAALPRLRMQGLAGEIAEAELRLTADESAAFLAGVAAATTPERLADAQRAIAGWPAGARLLWLRLHEPHGGDPLAGIAPGAAFAGALLDAVLTEEDPETAALLQAIAILPRVSGDLADAILPAPPGSSAPRLADLARRRVFLAPEDGAGTWYRPHQLLREALLERRPSGGAGEDAARHRRAAAWFERHGEIDAAIGHLLDAGDPGAAADLVERAGMEWLERETWVAIRDWMARIPPDLRETRPALLALRASLALHAADAGSALALADRIEERLAAAPEDRRAMLRWHAEGVRLRVALGHGRAIEVIDRARALMDMTDSPAAGHEARTMATAAWAAGMQQAGRADEAVAVLTAAVAGRPPSDRMVACRRLAIASTLMREADLPAAERAAARLEEAALAAGLSNRLKWARHFQGGLAYERNDLPVAEARFRAALDVAPGEYLGVELDAAWGLLLSLLGQGRLEDARAHAASARTALALAGPGPHRPFADLLEARIALAAGDPGAALPLVLSRAADPAWIGTRGSDSPAAVAAMALLARGLPGDAAQALALLDAPIAAARAMTFRWHLARLLPLAALAADAAGDHELAAGHLREALPIGGPAMVRRFLDHGVPMRRLLADLRPRLPVLARDIDAVLEAFAAAPPEPAPPPARPAPAVAPPAGGEPAIVLTRRERQVLDAVARGLSNDEIAAELFVSPNTVKGHLKRLFRKLGVASRWEARDLAPGLLGDAPRELG